MDNMAKVTELSPTEDSSHTVDNMVKLFGNYKADDEISTSSSHNQSFNTSGTSSCTLKRNPKSELPKSDLLKLLAQFEGELQARDIVIATLKSEKVKQYLAQNRSDNSGSNPLAALQRDNFATHNNNEKTDMCLRINQQLNSLENLILQQRRSQFRVAKVIDDAEIRHNKELELEKRTRRRFEKEYIKLSELFDNEQNRHKQIVLFLLAERKKIILKYIEERKRSEDFSQILHEEKCRVDSIAKDLEEESKKSLRFEAELEKQAAQFWSETQQLKQEVAKYKKRCEELEVELAKSEHNVALLEKQLESIIKSSSVPGGPHVGLQYTSSIVSSINPVDGSSCASVAPGVSSCPVASMMTSVAKVVQPTATVSSVPVSSPMTGIARSVSPGQSHNVRYVMYTPASVPVSHQVISTIKFSDTAPSAVTTIASRTPVYNNILGSSVIYPPQSTFGPRICMPQNIKPVPNNVNNKVVPGEQTVSGISVGIRKQLPLAIGRGVPPPVPPNKPVVPPKKEAVLARKSESSVISDSTDVKSLSMHQRCNIPVVSKLESANATTGKSSMSATVSTRK